MGCNHLVVKFMNLYKNIFLTVTFSMMLLSRIIAQPTNIKFDQIGLEQGLSQSSVFGSISDLIK
jgi:hypothetical protein